MKDKLRGTGVAIVTPFKKNKEIDFDALDGIIDHIINGGVEYIVSLGTTGESATLSKDEKNIVLDFTIAKVNNRIPVVAGFGGNNTQSVINDIKNRDMAGISAILSVSPYYNKPTQNGIYEHYKAIADSTDMPIIIYNVPGRTSSNITSATTLKLAHEIKNIIAVKEASGNLVQCMEIVQDKPEDFLVISGEDALTLPMISFGMDGVISVVANAFPKDYSEMVRLALKGEFKEASRLHFKLLNIIDLLFVEGNPGGVKYALEVLGLCENEMRLPLVSIGEETKKKLRSKIEAL